MQSTERVPIAKTIYRDYFEDIEDIDLCLLSSHEANKAWDQSIDPRATSYFSLPDDSWLIQSSRTSLGEWLTAFNNDDRSSVSQILEKNFEWVGETIVQYFVKRNIVFQTTWGKFLQSWDEFLAAEDDCPIVMSQETGQLEALLFQPIGIMAKIDNHQPATGAMNAVLEGLNSI